MSGTAGSGSAGSVGLVGLVVWRFLAEYGSSMPSCLKVLDAYVLLTGALQFGYCLGISTFPFNPFLSSFISTIGSFTLSSQCGPCAVSPGSQGIPLTVMFAWLLQTAYLHLKFRDSGSGQAPLKVPNPARELAQKTQHSGKQHWQSTTHPHRSTRDFPGEVT
uniref:Dolichyl-diphosphooligosaccharide--protein glycosyltransferase subunit DAD1 n=1 Tax=Anas platyrhynchos TaxID=8839 RepID=A0A8B9T0P2_ANAPL